MILLRCYKFYEGPPNIVQGNLVMIEPSFYKNVLQYATINHYVYYS